VKGGRLREILRHLDSDDWWEAVCVDEEGEFFVSRLEAPQQSNNPKGDLPWNDLRYRVIA
jgi:hypothetical protein